MAIHRVFDELQQTIEEVYLLDTPKGGVWIRSKICYQETDEAGNTKIYGIAETYGVRLPGIAKQ